MSSICDINPIECSQVKKGHHVIIQKRPCKIVDFSHAKTGKHGHMKVNLVGIDILTSKKYTWMGAGHLNITEFKPIRHEYSLVIMDGDSLTCLDANGIEVKIVLNEELEIYNQLKQEINNGKNLTIIVITAPIEISEGKYRDEISVDSYKEEKD